MREIRPYGSEGGVALTPPSLPLSNAPRSACGVTLAKRVECGVFQRRFSMPEAEENPKPRRRQQAMRNVSAEFSRGFSRVSSGAGGRRWRGGREDCAG